MTNLNSGYSRLESSNVHAYLRDKLGVNKYEDPYYRKVEWHVINGTLNVRIVDNRDKWEAKLKRLRDTQYRDLK